MRLNENGFTLIELLVVVSIVSILSSIAIASFGEYKGRAQIALMESGRRAAITDIEAYVSDGDFRNIAAWRRIFINGTPQQHADADEVLPAARPSVGHYIWVDVRSDECSNEFEDKYSVHSTMWNSTKRLAYVKNCDGSIFKNTPLKNPGTWW